MPPLRTWPRRIGVVFRAHQINGARWGQGKANGSAQQHAQRLSTQFMLRQLFINEPISEAIPASHISRGALSKLLMARLAYQTFCKILIIFPFIS